LKTKKNLIQAYYSHCLRADVPKGIKTLRKAAKNQKEKQFAKRVDSRFVSGSERTRINTADPFLKAIILAYRKYYREALLSTRDLKKPEARHESRLRSVVENFGLKVIGITDWAGLEKLVEREIHRRGYHCLLGRVSPLRSLLVWKKQNVKTFRVKLLGGTEKIPVVFLRDFAELGWLHYATFGRYYVGGWAKKNALYCVAQAYGYKFQSDAFRASYLAHEAQHFADYRTFPKLKQADLEYRAKLAELVAHSRPSRRIKFFRSEAKNDSSKPHCFASYQLVKHFGFDEGQQSKSISEIATQLLKEHTTALNKAGGKAATTKWV
jgi:hypothetical protein